MSEAAATALVELTGVHVALGARSILRNISWKLRAGEHWFVSGGNGAGKTTLLRAVRGDVPVVYGIGRRTYNLVGTGDSVGLAKARIGHLSPEFHERLLRMELPLTVRELVAGGVVGALYVAEKLDRRQERRVETLLERAGLASLRDEPMIELSFGQLRRALLARALAGEPKVLLLDEFAHGIDRHSRDVILGVLEDFASSETALVVATHRHEDLPRAISRELRLQSGEVVFEGALSKFDVPLVHGNGARRPVEGASIVKLQHVDVFIEGRPVLHDITWEIRRGESWLVSGRNGAGKTTLAKLLYGRLRAAYGGSVERFGSHGSLSVAELRRSVVLVSDDEQRRYDWNIPLESVVVSGYFASVGLMQQPTGEQLAQARRLLDEFGLAPLRRRPFLELSFGERRLALVARALVRTPQLLILDEALNGFDAAARAKIFRRIEELSNAGTALVVIGHHEADVPEWVDKELVLEGGRIANAGAFTRPRP